MSWVYLSPHFDDVALSCGGLAWQQVQASEQVSIWTICAGEPPLGELSPFAQMLHSRWEAGNQAVVQRKAEDFDACHILGVSYRHFSIPDCIYRRDPLTGEHLYASEAALNGSLRMGDIPLIQELCQQLENLLPTRPLLVCPLGLGNHVDHQLTRLAVEGLGCEVSYYADFPYVLHHQDQLGQLAAAGWSKHIFSISGAGLQAWQDSIAAFASQISTFWANETEMRQAIKDYWLENNGVCLWTRPAR